MKPHPRIRKTIKWGGAALTVLLVVVWIGSFWWGLSWYSLRRGSIVCSAGGITVFYHAASKQPTAFAGWRVDSVDELTISTWWFSGVILKSWDTWSSVSVPIWFPAALTLLPTALAFRLDTLARRRARMNLCPKCHYDRTGLAGDAVCPECGTGSGTA